jgi:hypothetical protein
MEDMRKGNTIIVGKAEGKRPLDIPKRSWELLKWILKKSVSRRATDSSGSG